MAVLSPGAAAVAWVPIRAGAPDLDLALAMVVLVMAAGATGRHLAVVTAAVVAALGFEYFDTRPFDQLAISRQPDVETTVLLAIVGLVAGECVLRLRQQRSATAERAAALDQVGRTASMLASGEEVVLVVRRAADQIKDLLDLVDCRFEAVAPVDGEAVIDREGRLVAGESTASVAWKGRLWSGASLPVWGQGEVLGRFVLQLGREEAPRREQLLVAVTLSDQVGAALSAYSPPGPPPPGEDRPPGSALRLLR